MSSGININSSDTKALSGPSAGGNTLPDYQILPQPLSISKFSLTIFFPWLLRRKLLPFVDICFRSREMSFQSLGNLEKRCEKKIEHFVPL